MPLTKNASFRQLAAFDAVARHGSVSRAAQEMHLTQPAVSIQIGLLEESAGTPLLARTGRGIRLTEAGELLAGYAGRILDLWREAGEQMAAHRGIFAGTLRVGAITTAEYLLPPLLVGFVDVYPKVKVKLQVGNREQIVRMLAGQEIDVAIMGRPPTELKTEATAIAKHPMAFVASPQHPLMNERTLTLARLADERILVRERGSGTRTTVERLFKDARLTLHIGSELSSNEAIKHMCAAGFGIAFLSLHTCVLEVKAGLLAPLPMEGNPVQRDWYVMHLASRQLPHVAQTFEHYLRTQAQAQVLKQLGMAPAAPARKRAAPATPVADASAQALARAPAAKSARRPARARASAAAPATAPALGVADADADADTGAARGARARKARASST